MTFMDVGCTLEVFYHDSMGKADYARKKTRSNCLHCGKRFFPFNKGKFCTSKCAGIFNGRRRAERARLGFAEPPPVRGARWIPLGKGRFALVDSDQHAKVSHHLWYGTSDRGVGTCVDGRRVLLHHFVTGIPSHIIVDHKNLDVFDNRRRNLRPATRATNGQNAEKHVRGAYTKDKVTSKYKGVWWDSARKRWCAMISANGVRYPLGRFRSETAAARAYAKAAKRLHGAFARPTPEGAS